MLHKQIFYINSRNRLTGTDSSFSYKLNIDQYVDYKYVSLISISIRKTFYSVQEPYNTFTLRHGLTDYLITIPEENYTRTSFAKILQIKLNEVSSFIYTITFPNINRTVDNGKYTFTVSNNLGVQPIVIVGGNCSSILVLIEIVKTCS